MNSDNIRIVLVGTTHPGNIGSAARAMKTMCLSSLHLVTPREFPNPQAEANAAHAADLVASAQVHDNLEQALADCRLVIGLSARQRRLSAPVLDVRQCARKVAAESAGYPVALLFGREHSGLTNEELDRCNYLVHIPANPEYSSLNVAAAVQVICYEILMASRDAEPGDAGEAVDAASGAHLEGLYNHLDSALSRIGYVRPEDAASLMHRLRRLFNRARPDESEINLLRGILSYIERHWPS